MLIYFLCVAAFVIPIILRKKLVYCQLIMAGLLFVLLLVSGIKLDGPFVVGAVFIMPFWVLGTLSAFLGKDKWG